MALSRQGSRPKKLLDDLIEGAPRSRGPEITYAKRLIFEPAAATEAAVEFAFVGAVEPPGAAARLAAEGGCIPTSCSSALKAFPNRLCTAPTGTWAAVLLLLVVESVERSDSEPFL
jgi:hypothetical protein